MTTLPPVANAMEIALGFTVGGDSLAVVRQFWAYTGSVPTPAAMTTMAGSVNAAAATHFTSLYDSSVSFVSATLTDLSTTSGARGVNSFAVPGTRTGEPLSASTACVISETISRRYRGGKPRSYFPFGTAADLQSSKIWATAFLTAVQTGVDAYNTAVTGVTSGGTTIAGKINISYYSGFTNVPYGTPTKYRRVATPRVTPLVDAITSSTPAPKPGNQRRRGRAA